MRVSDRQRFSVTESRVGSAKANNAMAQERVTTQKRLNHISDDPVSFSQVIRRRSSLNEMEQYQKNIDFSKGYIERAEASLKGISDNLIRAKELAVSLANGTYDELSREAAGREAKEIIEGVVGLANAQYGGRYVLGGFRTETPPLSRDGNFLGDDGAIFLQIDHGTFRQINIQSRGLFEPDAEERALGRFGMIETLDMLQRGLNENNIEDIRRSMSELDNLLDRTSSYQATLGAIYNGVDNAFKRIDLTKEVTQKEISGMEDVDAFTAASDFKRTENILQSTLLSSSKLLQPSLLNFMQ